MEAPVTPKETENKSSTYPVEPAPTKDSVKISGYNGADEDDIMDKVIKKLAVVGRDSTNNKTGQLFLSKDKARRAGEIILEATHKLKQEEVPAWTSISTTPGTTMIRIRRDILDMRRLILS